MSFLILALFGASYYTFVLKDRAYGETPPFASFVLLIEEASLRSWYAIEKTVRSNGLLGAVGTPLSFASSTQSDIIVMTPAQAIPVLTYHRIASTDDEFTVTRERFRNQMFALKAAGWETITLDEFRSYMKGEAIVPQKSVLITFDDGAKESFYPVDPLFELLGYEGVIYIIAVSAHIPGSAYYLYPPEIERMLETGRWEIGSHSYDGHRAYPADASGRDGVFFADLLWLFEAGRLETEEEFTLRVRDDLIRARGELETTYGMPIETFAFPLGNETGVRGAANFPEGASITEYEANRIYDLGFLQTDNTLAYTYNYPEYASFIARRIRVEYDWDAARLLEELEGGLPKSLPYQDDFSDDRGWILSWGTFDLGRNNFDLHTDPKRSSASVVLDGTILWDDYVYHAALDWESGSAFLLADVEHSKTYRACAFSDGVVEIQETRGGETRILARHEDARITYGSAVAAGIRVHNNTIECLWDYTSVVESHTRTWSGGIGVQTWNPEIGTATLGITEILVRPYSQ